SSGASPRTAARGSSARSPSSRSAGPRPRRSSRAGPRPPRRPRRPARPRRPPPRRPGAHAARWTQRPSRPAARRPGRAPTSPAPRGDSPPAPDSSPLLDHVTVAGDDRSAALARTLLGPVWVVQDLASVAGDFRDIAVTRDGRVWSPRTREVRQVPPGGEDRVL